MVKGSTLFQSKNSTNVFFISFVEFHERSLIKVLGRKHGDLGDRKLVSERRDEITVTLAEHLLGRLAPGQTYVVNGRTRSRGACSCGRDHSNNPTYRSTGIGTCLSQGLDIISKYR
jgi:hypothetical protein